MKDTIRKAVKESSIEDALTYLCVRKVEGLGENHLSIDDILAIKDDVKAVINGWAWEHGR